MAMVLPALLDLLRDCEACQALERALLSRPPQLPAAPLGLLAAARPVLLAALHAHVRRPLLVLVGRADAARAMVQQMQLWSPHPETVMRLPDPDALPYERIAWGRDTVCERIRVLTAMAAWPLEHDRRWPPLVVISARGLMHKSIPPAELRGEIHSLHVGQRVATQELLAHWLRIGYRPASTVEEPGTFSRRGGIIDIFPSHQPHPVRIELFGDEIESLRTFDPFTQRSERRIERFRAVPAHEALAMLGPAALPAVQRLDLSTCHPAARLGFDNDMEQLAQAAHFRGMEFYLSLFYEAPSSPLEYLPPDGLLIVEDPVELTSIMHELDGQAGELARDLERQGELPHGLPVPYFTPRETVDAIRRRPHLVAGHEGWPGVADAVAPDVASHSFPPDFKSGEPDQQADLLEGLFTPAPSYGGQIKRLTDDLLQQHTRSPAEDRAGERSECVMLVSRQAARLAELLSERGVAFAWGEPLPTAEEVTEAAALDAEGVETITVERGGTATRAGITLVQGSLAEGWALNLTLSTLHTAERERESGGWGEVSRALLLTDAEIFGYYKPESRRRSPFARRSITPETFFADLQRGDHVVHVEHGIGVFQGLVKLDLEGVENEYLQVDYAANDRLYVPIHQADRLSRYVGVEDRPPALNRLGTADWGQVKRRAKRAVEEIAQELLEIYAAREIAPGHAFGPDTSWQQELEVAFPYFETDDQLRAIEQVKKDMEKAKPMDRLICGDVGYGKTEVALRAGFKAVMAGMQVALLVPTTVLAQQHFQTFSERLKPYPVVVEMLSRFRSRKEQEDILRDMQAGKVDIIIGTHRLLQKDVHFKSLGLLIIDEEQRFGVGHKERLKKMRTEVDVLTLTATPIPRTLYMSLTGVRDMSTIDTPPAERLPVKTTVSQYDEMLIRTAILREMDRGGQVYFVHNRVMGIDQLAQRLQKIVPEARIAVAHGQMPESRLERVMMDFVAQACDVLVCTSIIESGLDIPNANTIIIHQAHRFGLAQLYQLRGRVGRGAVRAYAYLLTPKDTEIGQVARKRLQSIAEASELGAGFRIAMRDLEIRGAGDILGARQHGHIVAVGFDLYTRLLAQAVRGIRNGRHVPAGEEDETLAYLSPLQEGIQINLPLQVCLPEDYAPDADLRLRLYRRMAGLLSLPEVEAMGQELVDRFGELPEPTQNLLYQLRLKVLALESDIQSISVEAGQVLVKAEGIENLNRDALQRYTGPAVRVSRRQIWVPLHPDSAVWQAELERVLRLVHRMLHDPGR
jgi:transcription-repair coupling factor (superfamily II helicase)